MTPSIGRIVHVPMDPATNNGANVAPAVVTRVWNENLINVRILGDGHAIDWRTSVAYIESLDLVGGLDPLQLHVWSWPPREG